MSPEDSIHKFIGLVQLTPRAGPRNNNGASLKHGDCNSLTGCHLGSISLARAESRASADSPSCRGSLVVIILRVYSLIDCRLQRAGKIVGLAQNPVKLGPLCLCVHFIITVEELDIELLQFQRHGRNGSRESIHPFQHPGNHVSGELLVRNTRHLESAIREEFHIDFLEIAGVFSRLSNDNRALIEEGLVAYSALREEVARRVPHNIRLVLHFEEALHWKSDWNEQVLYLGKQGAEIDAGPEMAGGDQRRDSQGCESKGI